MTDSSSSEDESLPPLVTDSSSESLPPLVESSSSGSATIMLDDSSSSDDSATLGELRHKLFQPKKCGGKDCERCRSLTTSSGDLCVYLCLTTSGQQHDEECTDVQAARQGLCEKFKQASSQSGIQPLTRVSMNQIGFRSSN